MPGIKELEKFKNELRGIANEPEIMANWGEKYEEIPLPKEAPVPDVNVDDLLGGIVLDNLDKQEDKAADKEKVADLDNPTDFNNIENEDIRNTDTENLPDLTDLDNIGDFSQDTVLSQDIPEMPETAETSNLDSPADNPDLSNTFEMPSFDAFSKNGETIESPSESKDNQMQEISLFMEERDEEDEPDTGKFNDMVSGLNLDSFGEQENQKNPADEKNNTADLDSDVPDVPEALLSGFGEMVEEARKNPDKEDSSFPDFSIDEPINTKSDFGEKDIPEIETLSDADEPEELKEEDDESLTSVSETEDYLPPTDIEPENYVYSNAETSEPSGFDMPDISDSGLEDLDVEEISSPTAEDTDIGNFTVPDISDSGLEDFEMPDTDSSDTSGNFKSGEPSSVQLENFDIGDLTPSIETDYSDTETEGSLASENETYNASQTAPPDFSGIDIPDLDEHTAFAIDDDVLNTDMGGGMDEFSVPESFTQFSPDKGFKFFDSKKTISEEEYEGKIPLSISESDYDKLIERISSFPLNVRLEIEDYLANGDDTELNKMEIVHLIISGVSLKKIAAKLEGILEKPITIPKGFDKKSYDEYEKEKKSFKYRFMHKILPAAILTAITAVLVFSILVLVWQFIYKPVTAEGIYKNGFAGIENGQYENAIKLFDEAGTYKKKRSWYFKFANAFRAKKQFLSAEAIYKRLLFDFNHDVQGGIEYADMLSTDLRNYEKAEEVLRRGVLDYHINDKNALLALGDVYLDWADEDSEKYENARKTFVSIINMYGENNTVLGRMMRYFIRTDNLAEVLPLKEHFLNTKFDKDELIELSGYLLEKRYEPKPSDSDKLRSQIEDLRELLERAIKTAPESPEANYNLGRFFIHNYKPEAAKVYLETAVKLYQDSIKMTPKRVIRELDSMRLYGELLSNDKRYNEAQEIYAKALSKYEDYTAQKRVYPSNIIGKLYADYGDISYFVSGDYDSALNAYEKASQELNNTPSIQYRIGYIHYQKENYIDAMTAMTLAYTEKPNDRNLLYGFGNVLFKRGNYFASQAYYERLMELLEAERIRKGIVFPQSRVDHAEFVENYMQTANNLGVVLNRIAVQNGDSNKNGRAISLLGESTRAWDALNRNPETMIRSKAVNLAYANIQNIVKPRSLFTPEIYSDIPKTLENEKVLQQLEDR
ncbi:periplasmic flagellar collar protein FlcA [Treponema pedis]|uniref:periplasmic flagellar collar protein FlcA n=1 Tax=Treponema pedis TaxID=409322 RepID=UPI00041057E1|nr:tetratricopeptide repeat protein [Treponema pedis]